MSIHAAIFEETERHIRQIEERIAGQQALLARIEDEGNEAATATARKILATFHATLYVAQEHRRIELEEIARRSANTAGDDQ